MSIPAGHLPVDNAAHTRFMTMERIYRTRRNRLRKAAHELFPGTGSQRQLAEHLGREPNYISRMLSTPDKKGHKRIGEELARQFEHQLGKPVYWLDGILEMESADKRPEHSVPVDSAAETVSVAYYPDIYASAGHGCLPISEATVTLMEIARAALDQKRVNPDHAALIQADGDSMKGTVDHRDIMLVNLADTEPRDGRVYVVSIDEDVLVKRVQRIPRGIKLIADNPAYDPIEVMEEDQQTPVSVIGRVILAWHSRDLLE